MAFTHQTPYTLIIKKTNQAKQTTRLTHLKITEQSRSWANYLRLNDIAYIFWNKAALNLYTFPN